MREGQLKLVEKKRLNDILNFIYHALEGIKTEKF